jgi:hypothetical protein
MVNKKALFLQCFFIYIVAALPQFCQPLTPFTSGISNLFNSFLKKKKK